MAGAFRFCGTFLPTSCLGFPNLGGLASAAMTNYRSSPQARLAPCETRTRLFVEGRTKNCDHEMRKIRSSFIQLEPAHHAVLGQILPHARFRDSQVFGQPRLDRFHATPARTSPQKVGDCYAQRLASFHVVIAGEIRIRKDKYARSCRSVIRFFQFGGRAGHQPAKLHLQQRNSGGKPGITVAAFHAWPARLSDRLHGQAGNRPALCHSGKSRLSRIGKNSGRQSTAWCRRFLRMLSRSARRFSLNSTLAPVPASAPSPPVALSLQL